MGTHEVGIARKRELALAGLAGIGFVGLGLPDGLLGVAWPSMRGTFGVPLDALGALLASFTTGYVASSFAGGRLIRTLGLGGLLTLSCGASAISLMGYASASAWWIVVALGLVAGLGAGGIDTGVNTYAAMRHGPRMLNALHACYGIGAAGGPAIMTAVFASHRPWQWGFVAAGGAQIALAAAFAATRRAWPAVEGRVGAGPGVRAAPFGETLRLPVARLSILLFVCYTGLELAVGAWAFTLLTEGRGVSPITAGSWVSLYWVGLTGGRVAGAALVNRVGAPALLQASISVLAGGLGVFAAAVSPFLDFAGLVLAGAAAGPIFPTLISQTPLRLGDRHTANAVGFQIAAAAIGQSAWPSALGILGDAYGLNVLGYGLVGLAVSVFVVNDRLARWQSGASATPRPLDQS